MASPYDIPTPGNFFQKEENRTRFRQWYDQEDTRFFLAMLKGTIKIQVPPAMRAQGDVGIAVAYNAAGAFGILDRLKEFGKLPPEPPAIVAGYRPQKKEQI